MHISVLKYAWPINPLNIFCSRCWHHQSVCILLSRSMLTYLWCFALLPCTSPSIGVQIDCLDRMRQNQCQLKFCCRTRYARGILCYRLRALNAAAGLQPPSKTDLPSLGWRYKGTCFTLMVYAFLINISCTECPKSQSVFTLLGSHLCP